MPAVNVAHFLCPMRRATHLSMAAGTTASQADGWMSSQGVDAFSWESGGGHLAEGMGTHVVVLPVLPQKYDGTSYGDVDSLCLCFPTFYTEITVPARNMFFMLV